LEIIAQVASALLAAEKQGLVHRDLKPANLMLLSGPGINVKVIDFGLAKIVGTQDRQIGLHRTVLSAPPLSLARNNFPAKISTSVQTASL
jgi:serine/threonine protein kinase